MVEGNAVLLNQVPNQPSERLHLCRSERLHPVARIDKLNTYRRAVHRTRSCVPCVIGVLNKLNNLTALPYNIMGANPISLPSDRIHPIGIRQRLNRPIEATSACVMDDYGIYRRSTSTVIIPRWDESHMARIKSIHPLLPPPTLRLQIDNLIDNPLAPGARA